MQPEDAYWRRPEPPVNAATGAEPPVNANSGAELNADATPSRDQRPGPSAAPPVGPAPYPGLAYQGPPRAAPPPAGWQPQQVVVPPGPRSLPPQDHATLDAAEERAAALTRVVAVVAGLIILALLCTMCAGWIF